MCQSTSSLFGLKREKQQILPFDKIQPAILFFYFDFEFNYLLIIKIIGYRFSVNKIIY